MKAEHIRACEVPAFSNELARGGSTFLDRWALARIQQTVPSAPIRFVLWDGYERSPLVERAAATILIRNRRTLAAWVWDADLNFGEAYMSGAIEVRGDLISALDALYRASAPSAGRRWWLRATANDATRSQANVHDHYDLGNTFYRLWLDREMVYTCAYFPTREATLEAAQLAKMDLICRKLQLKAGEHVIEAGCGWGSLALFMARRYGVTVQAFNISSEQIAYART